MEERFSGHFYSTFVALSNYKTQDNESSSEEKEMEMLSKSKFRNYLLSEVGPSFSLVCKLAPSLTKTVTRPQRLILDDPDYYIAIDLMTNTYYVCYRELLMVDVDFYKNGITTTEKEIQQLFFNYCKNGSNNLDNKSLRFRLYKTRNGVHGFLISQNMNYQSENAISMMLDLDSDFFYAVYSYIRGWSVRLNRKNKEPEGIPLYSLIGDVGDGLIDQKLEKLVNLHIELLSVFENAEVNSMYGE